MSFKQGQMVVTCGVGEQMTDDEKFSVFVKQSMARHAAGDWGNLSDADKRENEYSLNHDLRLLSAYEKESLPKIWIITEADRSATTVLFPDEY